MRPGPRSSFKPMRLLASPADSSTLLPLFNLAYMSFLRMPTRTRDGKYLNQTERQRYRLRFDTRHLSWAAAFLSICPLLHAQDALRTSLAGNAAAEARMRQLDSQAYTIKEGDFRLLVVPSLGLDWNDNVNLAKGGGEQDFILKPFLNLHSSYPITRQNVLQFHIGVGYDKYFDHDEFSGPRVISGSETSFDIFVKDWVFDLHDRFSFTKDSAGISSLAGTGQFGGFENTAGVSGTWDLQDVVLTFGYDHQNFISSEPVFDYVNHSAELVVARGGFRLNPKLTVGVEGTGSFTTYDEKRLNDSRGYSGGVYANWQPGRYFRVQPRAGYTFYDFRQTSLLINAVDQSSWYADLAVTHNFNEAISYTLSAGHDLRLGIQADSVESSHFRASIDWKIIKDLSLNTYFSYEHGTQGAGNAKGSVQESFDWFGGGIGLNYPLMKKLAVGLNYRLTLRSSDAADRGYAQNLVGLLFTYKFQ